MTVSAEEFKRRKMQEAWEEPREVTLPSGMEVTLREPKAIWFALVFDNLPGSLAARTSGDGTVREMEPEEIVALSKAWVLTFEQMFVSPVLRENPKEGEVGYLWILKEDRPFLHQFARGEIKPQGNLENFPGQPQLTGAGPGGGTVEVQTERTA